MYDKCNNNIEILKNKVDKRYKNNQKFHEEPEETETTQKDTFSKKINAKINEYIDKNVNNK